jgi:transposase
MRNLAKARAKMRPPRPWRSTDESRMIRRYVFLWYTGHGQKPSGREWARQLGISHTWLQKLIRQFEADPNEMYRESKRCGDPSYAQLLRARAYTQVLRDRGEVRPTGRAKQIEDFLKRSRG